MIQMCKHQVRGFHLVSSKHVDRACQDYKAIQVTDQNQRPVSEGLASSRKRCLESSALDVAPRLPDGVLPLSGKATSWNLPPGWACGFKLLGAHFSYVNNFPQCDLHQLRPGNPNPSHIRSSFGHAAAKDDCHEQEGQSSCRAMWTYLLGLAPWTAVKGLQI